MFTTYRKYAVTRNYKSLVFYSDREKQVSAFSGSRKEGAGRREQGAGRREQGGGSREEGVGRRVGGSIRFPIMDVPL